MYNFEPDIDRRFNPEIDHIFPVKLDKMEDEYKDYVDILWNMQPVKGDINGYKLNHHPVNFFNDKLRDKKGNIISGSKFFSEYDFVPELTSELWTDYRNFIHNRKEKMKQFLKTKYDLEFLEN